MPKFKRKYKSTKSEGKQKMLSYTPIKTCNHSKPKLVFPGVYAGSGMSHCDVPDNAVVLDLANYYYPTITQFGINIGIKVDPTIVIQWPDHSVPDVSIDDWIAIVKVLHSNPLFVACAGGHGRTGTALAIIGSLINKIPEGCPVEYIRKEYCDRAVESNSQIKYIEEITGRKVTATIPKIVYTAPVGGKNVEYYGFDHEYKSNKFDPTQCGLTLTDQASLYGLCGGVHICGKHKDHKANHECDTMSCKIQWPKAETREQETIY